MTTPTANPQTLTIRLTAPTWEELATLAARVQAEQGPRARIAKAGLVAGADMPTLDVTLGRCRLH